MMELLLRVVGDESCDFYLGGYGNFDRFARACCAEYKQTHPNVNLVFVRPYLTETKMQDKEYIRPNYDTSVYPELEDTPLRFAISRRNRWMVEKADAVIAYVDHHWGGAYQTYRCAKAKKKPIYNLSPDDPD
jgi:uncharacterized phage-like protein YoqJ